MAKAADIDIDPDEAYGRAAARIVRVRAGELFDEAAGVLDTDDIERVHAMRVASRRLRAVLEMFAVCFPKREYRGVLRDVKRIADALGMRRDPDVHIDAMQRFAKAAGSAAGPGIELLIGHLRREQAHGNEALAAELERLRTTDLHARLLALADHAEAMVQPEPEPEPGSEAEPAPGDAGAPEDGDEPQAEAEGSGDAAPEDGAAHDGAPALEPEDAA